MTGLHAIVGEKIETRVPASPFRVTHFGDMEESYIKDWMIEDTLGAGEITVWYGYPGGGKSVLLGDGAAHVAAGMSWFGRPVTQGTVLYVAAERARLVLRRLRAWEKHHDIHEVSLGVVDGVFDLFSNSDHADELIRIGLALVAHYKKKVRWVIIDTKARVMGGGDPNSDTDVLGLIANCSRIQSALNGPHLTLADHVPYSAPERIKGSGSLAGAIDGSFLIRRDGDRHSMTIGSKPPNDGPDEFSIAFTLASIEIGVDKDRGGKVTTAPVVVPAENRADVAAARRRSLNPAGQKVFSAFGRLFDEGRTCPAPNVAGVRPGTRAVTISDLRGKALSLGLFPESEPADGADRSRWRNGRNQAWKRGIEETQKAGLLRLENDFVWEPYARPPMTDTVTNGDQW
jgi:hypothetical protein